MVANVQPIFVRSANNAEDTHVAADGTVKKDYIVAGADGSKVFAINVCSDDTVLVNMQVFLYDGVTAYLVGTVPVPTLSGTDGIAAAVNLLDRDYIPGLDGDGELFLKFGYTIQCAPLVAVTGGKIVTVIALGADY